MELTKIQAKVKCSTGFVWSHFCYVPKDVKDTFDRTVNTEAKTSNHYINLWAKQDFDCNVTETSDLTMDGFETLKTAIKEKYKNIYPELYMESNIDTMGWMRLWYTEHMKKEIMAYDEQSRRKSE